MFVRVGFLLLAALFLPAAASAQTVAIAEAQATARAVGKDDLVRCRQLWGEALARTGLSTVVVAGEGKGKAAGPDAEFVASLAVDRDGEAVVFTGLASRVRLDKWAVRHEARAPAADPDAWGAALDSLADQLASSVRAAPPRQAMQPPPRARVKLKHASVAPAASGAAEVAPGEATPAPAEEPEAAIAADAEDDAE